MYIDMPRAQSAEQPSYIAPTSLVLAAPALPHDPDESSLRASSSSAPLVSPPTATSLADATHIPLLMRTLRPALASNQWRRAPVARMPSAFQRRMKGVTKAIRTTLHAPPARTQ